MAADKASISPPDDYAKETASDPPTAPKSPSTNMAKAIMLPRPSLISSMLTDAIKTSLVLVTTMTLRDNEVTAIAVAPSTTSPLFVNIGAIASAGLVLLRSGLVGLK